MCPQDRHCYPRRTLFSQGASKQVFCYILSVKQQKILSKMLILGAPEGRPRILLPVFIMLYRVTRGMVASPPPPPPPPPNGRHIRGAKM